MRSTRLTSSLFGSLGVHGALLVWGLFGLHAPRPSAIQPDAWVGSSVEVDTAVEPSAAAAESPAHAEASEPASEATPIAPPPGPPLVTSEEPASPSLAAQLARVEPRRSPAPSEPTPKPKARPAPVASATSARASANAASPAERGASATDAASAPVAAQSGGAFGSQGLPAGVRNLPSAFTRALTRAASFDAVWRERPAGKAGEFTIAVEVDEPGHIASADFERAAGAPPIAPELVALRERVLGLLRGGQFALSGGGAGRERMRVSITLSDGPPSEDFAPQDVLELAFDPPRAGNVGRSFFRVGSGRRFEAVVVVLGK